MGGGKEGLVSSCSQIDGIIFLYGRIASEKRGGVQELLNLSVPLFSECAALMYALEVEIAPEPPRNRGNGKESRMSPPPVPPRPPEAPPRVQNAWLSRAAQT